MRRLLRSAASTSATALLAAIPVSAQSVADVVNQMYEAFEARAEAVDDYTLVQSVMGVETVAYFEKEMMDGHPVFRMKGSDTGGFSLGLTDEDIGQGDIFVIGPDLIEHGRYAGREEIAGVTVHVLAVDDLSAFPLQGTSGPDDMDFVAKSGRIYVDAATLAPRRLEFDGEAEADDGPHEVTVQMDMQDVREVEGLLIAHRTVISITGMGAMMDPEVAAQIEELRAQLETLPEAQRAMMERMLAEQMRQIEQMEAGGGDTMTFEVTVTDVRVNTGPPGA